MKLFISFTILFSLCLSSTTWRLTTETLSTDNEGPWGSWSASVFCNDGAYATGIRLKVQSYQGKYEWNDDSSATGFRMICDDNDELIAQNERTWGSWGNIIRCPSGSYIVGFNTKVESSQGGGDDTALNSAKAICSDTSRTVIEPSVKGAFGTWGNQNEFRQCKDRSSVCGFKKKDESWQGGGWVGTGGDDSALNAVKMFCCENKVTFSNIVGQWAKVQTQGGGGSISYWYTVGVSKSVENHISETWSKSLTAAAEASYNFLKVSLSATVAHELTKTSITSVSKTVETRKIFNCEEGDEALYQWVTSVQESIMSTTIDFEVGSNNMWCVSDMTLTPQCPPEFCIDEDCQICKPFTDGHTYTFGQIRILNSGLCLDGTGLGNGDNVLLWNCDGADNKLWKLNENNQIIGKSERCLDGTGLKQNDNVLLWNCDGADNKKWYLSGKSIKTKNGFCLDGTSVTNGANVLLYTCKESANQQWEFVAITTGQSPVFNVYQMIEMNVLISTTITVIILCCVVLVVRNCCYRTKGYNKVKQLQDDDDDDEEI